MLDGAQPGSHRQSLQLARQRLPSPKNDFAVHDFAQPGSHRQPLQSARQRPPSPKNDSVIHESVKNAKPGSHRQPLQLAGGARLPKNDSANP